MKKVVLLFLLSLMITSITKGQTIGGSFMLGFPQGEFKENVDRLGYGF